MGTCTSTPKKEQIKQSQETLSEEKYRNDSKPIYEIRKGKQSVDRPIPPPCIVSLGDKELRSPRRPEISTELSIKRNNYAPQAILQEENQEKSNAPVLLRFGDLISFFQSNEWVIGMVKSSGIGSPSSPLTDSLFRDVPISNLSSRDNQFPRSISEIILYPIAEGFKISPQFLDVQVPHAIIQRVLFPSSPTELSGLQRFYASQALRRQLDRPANEGDSACSNQSWMWGSLLSQPPPSSGINNLIDAAALVGRRALLFLSSFVSSRGPFRTSRSRPFKLLPPHVSRDLNSSLASLHRTNPSQEWNSERRSLRVSLCMADRFVAETERLMSKHSENGKTDTYLEVLPSYSALNSISSFCNSFMNPNHLNSFYS